MAISITASYYGPYVTEPGSFPAIAVLTVTGLTANADNAFSATSDGTSSGMALLPLSGASAAIVVGVPVYTPTNGNGSWYEAAAPDTDASSNVQFHIHSATSGPTGFRIGVMYGRRFP